VVLKWHIGTAGYITDDRLNPASSLIAAVYAVPAADFIGGGIFSKENRVCYGPYFSVSLFLMLQTSMSLALSRPPIPHGCHSTL
jgi:hypothetical protein